MSSQWTKAWKNTPGIDCGLCGRGACSGFVRAYLLGLVDIDSCPLLSLPKYSNQRSQLISLVNEGKRTPRRPAPEQPENGVLFTKPCADTDEKVMAELRISNGVKPGDMVDFMVFSPELLCRQLNLISSMFEKIKCSKDLGYARADYEEMSITFLNDGRVNMRRVDDEKQVKSLFSKLQGVLLGAIVCNCCGSDTFSILADFVTPLRENEHTVLEADVNVDLKFTLDLIRTKGYSSWNGEISEIYKAVVSIRRMFENGLKNDQHDVTALKASISEVEQASLKMLESATEKTIISQIVHLLMLMYFSRMGVRSLSKLDFQILSDIAEKFSEDSGFEKALFKETEIETAAHLYSLRRTLNLLKRWIDQ